GQPSPLPAPRLQYADFAVWQRAQMAGETLDRLINYWRSRLAEAPEAIDLPTDRPRLAQQTFRGGRVPLLIDANISPGFRQLTRSTGTTAFMVLLAALSVTLSRYSGQKDIVIGSPIANRTSLQTEMLVGCLTNT